MMSYAKELILINLNVDGLAPKMRKTWAALDFSDDLNTFIENTGGAA